MKFKKILISFIISSVGFVCYADVTRQDVVSLTLDYYELKQKSTAREQRAEETKKRIKEEKKKSSGEGWEKAKSLFKKYFRENLHFFAELELEFNDNIYKTHTDETSDMITRFSAGIDFIPKITEDVQGKTDLFFELRGDALGFSSEPSESTGNFHSKVGLTHRFTKKYGITLDFGADKDIVTATEVTGTGTQKELIDHWMYDYGVKLEGAIKRWPWDVSYRHTEDDYDEGFDTSEHKEDNVVFTGYIPLKGKKDLFASYEFGEVEYPNRTGSDYDYNKYWFGIRGKILRKFNGMIKFGWGTYDYDRGEEDDINEWRAELDYTPRKNVLLRLAGGLSIEPTTYTTDDSSERSSLSLDCRYLPPKFKKIILGAGISWDNYDFDSGREDDLWRYYLEGDYKMNKWVKVGVRYENNERDSNIPDRNYEQNVLSLIVRGDF